VPIWRPWRLCRRGRSNPIGHAARFERVGIGSMKVAVLTSSYPRTPGDTAGRFVADAVEHVRERGIEVEVVSPATVRHYGIAYGAGVVGNLRRRPARALLLPLMLRDLRRAATRAARDADLVHAHWLPLGGIALTLGKPFVVQLWGTDVELARRTPRLAGPARAAVRPRRGRRRSLPSRRLRRRLRRGDGARPPGRGLVRRRPPRPRRRWRDRPAGAAARRRRAAGRAEAAAGRRGAAR